MTKPGGEFFLKIYPVNNSLRLVIYDFRISHADCEFASGRIQHPEKRPNVGGGARTAVEMG